MEQHAEVAPQILGFVERKGAALFESGEDDLQALLDTPGERFRRPPRVSRS
jgi:hypothetical protein